MFDSLRIKLERRLARLVGTPPKKSVAPFFVNRAAVEALRLKGNAYIAKGDHAQAETCFRNALESDPDCTPLLICLGYALREQGRLIEARIALRKAVLAADPEVFEAYYLLGQISEQQQDWDDALRQFSASLERKPDFVQACEDGLRMLVIAKQQNNIPAFLEALIQRCPSVVEYRVLLGCFFGSHLDSARAVEHLQVAIELGAASLEVNLALGGALSRLNREEEAQPFLNKVLEADPSFAPHINFLLGLCRLRLGDEKAAIALLEESIKAHHDYVDAHTSLLMLLSYSQLDPSRAAYIAAARRFAHAIEPTTSHLALHHLERHDLDSTPLRVGFVAGEFRNHPVLHFLLGVLMHLNPQRIHTVAFSNNNRDDSGTDLFKAAFNQWFDIRDLDTTAATELIQGQRIDVLIDLCGMTGDGRLPVFAKRPAPVQVTWLGYWATTGLSSMDYILVDPVCVPENSTEWFSEKIYRLPVTRLCMTEPRAAYALPLIQPPCLSRGYVTFGSFQRLAKLNADVLALWNKVLQATPNSRLRIQTDASLADGSLTAFSEKMTRIGIDARRVDLHPLSSADQYFLAYNEVDIILDTFPFPGGTTTAQALWMGVPTVTLSSDTMLSLQGASMLSCVGLTDWIAKDETDYVHIACEQSRAPQYLAQLRSGLRDQVRQSPLFDVRRFAADLTDALWNMVLEKRNGG